MMHALLLFLRLIQSDSKEYLNDANRSCRGWGDVRIGEDSPIMTGQYFAVAHAFVKRGWMRAGVTVELG